MVKRIPGYDSWETSEDCIFNTYEANLAIDFIEECCVHVKGELAGKYVKLEIWEKAIVGNLFGWYNPDGTRRYREALIYVPRKNGKTFLSACISNLLFFMDEEPGAEIYCAAAERDQATIVWNMAKQQVEKESALNERCRIYPGYRVIERDGCVFKPISAEAKTKHGFNPSAVIFDELHVQDGPDLCDSLETGMGSRKNPLMIYLTTADSDRPSICNIKYEYACSIRDGTRTDKAFLPVIYEATLKDDWKSPEIWGKANPNLGVSVKLSYIKRQCKKAEEQPSYQNTFKRLHLNIKTETDVRWLLLEIWDQNKGKIDPEMLLGKPCFAGFDLASVSDLIAFVLYFHEEKAVLPFYWVPVDTSQKRRDTNRMSYEQWEKQKYIKLTEGNVADYDKIRADINEIAEKYNILEVAIDRWNSTQLQTQLGADGFEVIPFGQGFGSMSAPTKELERLIMAREICHFDNPVLRWNASNVMIETDAAGNMKPSKKKSNEKIDGIVALIMALGRALVHDKDKDKSVYEDRGLLML